MRAFDVYLQTFLHLSERISQIFTRDDCMHSLHIYIYTQHYICIYVQMLKYFPPSTPEKKIETKLSRI